MEHLKIMTTGFIIFTLFIGMPLYIMHTYPEVFIIIAMLAVIYVFGFAYRNFKERLWVMVKSGTITERLS